MQQETLHRLNGVASRLEEITHRLQEPAVVQDHTQYRSLMKEYDRLVPGVEAYKQNMFALLGKPGYEDLRQELLEKLGE